MPSTGGLTRVTAGGVLVAAGLWAASANIAPDATTHATQGYNVYEGDVAVLTDGLYPGNAADPGTFTWASKGNLVFQFEAPRTIERLRLFVGEDAGRYVAVAYRGAVFSEGGQTDASAAEFVADAIDLSMAQNTWVELVFPAGTQADYLELSTESGATFYEVEILGVDGEGTPVLPASWGTLKRERR
ncbi:MAG: hypothetical protein AB1505_01380 [Candidatus Latescibacterota bacterium]